MAIEMVTERPQLYTVETHPEAQQEKTIFIGDVNLHSILSAEGSVVIERGTLGSVEPTQNGGNITFTGEKGVIFTGQLSGNNNEIESLKSAQGGDVIASRTTFGNEYITFSVNPPPGAEEHPHAAD